MQTMEYRDLKNLMIRKWFIESDFWNGDNLVIKRRGKPIHSHGADHIPGTTETYGKYANEEVVDKG